MWIIRLFNFYGNKNVPVDNVEDIEKALIISKVNKASSISGNKPFAFSIIIIEFLIWFVILDYIVGNMHLLKMLGVFSVCYIFLLFILEFLGQVKYIGDTVIFFEDKIVETNWLYSKETLWSKVNKIYIYSTFKHADTRDKFQEVSQRKLAKAIWINIKIEAEKNKIFINTASSHNEELQNYIKEKHRDKIKSNETEGTQTNLNSVLVATGALAGFFAVGMVYLLSHYIGF